MDLKIVILSEVSQAQKDKYHMTPLVCGILKKLSVPVYLFDFVNLFIYL